MTTASLATRYKSRKVLKRLRTYDVGGQLWSMRSTLLLSVVYIVMCSLLAPTATYSYDEIGLLGISNSWLHYGTSLFATTKFGIEIPMLGVLAQSLAVLIATSHVVSGVAAVHIAWKLPLIMANLFTAHLLVRLGDRFGYLHSRWLGLMWLFSPAVFWVATGHGQIEPLSVLSTIWAMTLLLDRRYFSAGLICGLGSGVEYFPLILAVAVIFLLIVSSIRIRDAVFVLSGTLSGMVVSFGPSVIFGSGSKGLSSAVSHGVISSSGGSLVPWGLSIWNLNRSLQPPSSVTTIIVSALVVASIMITGIVINYRRLLTTDCVVVWLTAVMLLLIVLLDPISQAQYAVIVAAGLFLLIPVVQLPSIVAMVIPTVGLLTYFLFESPWVFFLGLIDRYALHVPRLPIPVSPEAAIVMARVFIFSCVYVVFWSGYGTYYRRREMRRRSVVSQQLAAEVGGLVNSKGPSSRGVGLSMGVGVLACGLLASLGANSQLWSRIGSNGPDTPMDLSGVLVVPGQPITFKDHSVRINYDSGFVNWIRSGSILPQTVFSVEGDVRSPYTLPSTKGWISIADSRGVRIVVPSASDVSRFWVRMVVKLVGLPSGSSVGLPRIIFTVDGVTEKPVNVVGVGSSAAVVSLVVVRNGHDANRAISIVARRGIEAWSAIGKSALASHEPVSSFSNRVIVASLPNVVVTPEGGWLRLSYGSKTKLVPFILRVSGDSSARVSVRGLPVVSSMSMDLSQLLVRTTGSSNLSIRYLRYKKIQRFPLIVSIGCVWLLLLSFGFWRLSHIRQAGAEKTHVLPV